ncbi:hypothetical protein LOD99_14684 [Oopsacas minuta]|uniref:DUSP domain-containing protein n=1 Tax=Oopsacas minuta TaxID=111878 RepID=A0AAV7KCR5_9METZ|nr:hypothetical protein LOD99_14684 [Oopsacas minuta]
MTSKFEEDPLAIFTTDLYKAITTMRDNLTQVFAQEFEESDSDILREVIFELCDELYYELLNYSFEMKVLHDFDILYWRRRNIFTNDSIDNIREFLHQQFYESLPLYPTHCINLCLVHDLDYLTPHFYLRRPQPSPEVIKTIQPLTFKKNDICYMIHRNWYEDLRDRNVSSPIFNLISVDMSRLDALNCESSAYYCFPEWGWRHLLAWYGIINCNLALKRLVIYSDMTHATNDLEIDLTASDVWCFLYPDTNEFRVIRMSSRDSITELLIKMKRVFNISSQKMVRIYCKTSSGYSNWDLLDGVKKSSSALRDNSYVMLVLPSQNGVWPDVKKDF